MFQHFSGDAKGQREAMNNAVKTYAKEWTGDEEFIQTLCNPCLATVEEPLDAAVSSEESSKDVKVLVTCQDFGQAIALPCFKLCRPNVDFFNSDLNIQMFNVCHLGTMKNSIFFYLMKEQRGKIPLLFVR